MNNLDERHNTSPRLRLLTRLARFRFGNVYARIALSKARNTKREKTANVSKIHFDGPCRDHDTFRL